MKTEYLIIGGLGVAAVVYATMGKKNIDTVSIDPTTPSPTLPVKTGNTTQAPTLKTSITLKKGAVGNEVRRLQTLLGVAVDGDFGTITEAALYAKKGVKQITLAAFASTLNTNTAALALGNRVMSRGAAKVTVAATNAKKEFYDSGVSGGTFGYGVEVGKIVSMTASKNVYVVLANNANTFFHDVYLWVNAADVSKI